jgi:aldose 1-epimerase
MAKDLYLISNDLLRASITNYGARLVSLDFKSRSGNWVALCAGFANLETYEQPEVQYFGATVGRVAGRLARGRFALGSQVLALETNEGPNHLHGGDAGAVHNKEWMVSHQSPEAISLKLTSPAFSGGFPGNVELAVEYRLFGSSLQITQQGKTDSDTPLNLTNHTYWNLSGEGDSASSHNLQISSDRVIPVDSALLPIGPAELVADSELDFRTVRNIGVLRKLLSEPLPGYDHTYLLGPAKEVRKVATLSHPKSGISMTVSTNAEALQFYSGNRNPTLDADSGFQLSQGSTVCLEAFGVNNPELVGDYPSIVISPERPLQRVVTHRFDD